MIYSVTEEYDSQTIVIVETNDLAQIEKIVSDWLKEERERPE